MKNYILKDNKVYRAESLHEAERMQDKYLSEINNTPDKGSKEELMRTIEHKIGGLLWGTELEQKIGETGKMEFRVFSNGNFYTNEDDYSNGYGTQKNLKVGKWEDWDNRPYYTEPYYFFKKDINSKTIRIELEIGKVRNTYEHIEKVHELVEQLKEFPTIINLTYKEDLVKGYEESEKEDSTFQKQVKLGTELGTVIKVEMNKETQKLQDEYFVTRLPKMKEIIKLVKDTYKEIKGEDLYE